MPPERGQNELLPDPRIARWQALTLALGQGELASHTALAHGLLAAVALGLTGDSRQFCRDFGLSHALVLREISILCDEAGLLCISRCDEKTQRHFLALTPKAGQLLAGLPV
jgi:hypothetical protein